MLRKKHVIITWKKNLFSDCYDEMFKPGPKEALILYEIIVVLWEFHKHK